MTGQLTAPFKADHVGSFLRPAKLKEAREQFANGEITQEALRKIEDEAIIDLIQKQKDAGMISVTDGEFRRKYWHYDFISYLNGIETYVKETPGFFQGELQKLHQYYVKDKLSFPKDHPFLADFDFVKKHAGEGAIAKQTIPGPNMIFHNGVITSKQYKAHPAYESIQAVADAISDLYQDIIQTFYDHGCRYLQLDDTSWGAFFDDKFRDLMKNSGHEPNEIIKVFADITVNALKNKPEDMTITMHICRGNFKSAWLYEGGDYSAISNDLFSRVNVDAFFLEYDTDRAGDFEPLKAIKNQTVVLGLVTTKTGELEDKAAIKGRIKEATQYLPLEQLALSPQCGFASTEEGNDIAEASQWEKLRLIKEIADEVWS